MFDSIISKLPTPSEPGQPRLGFSVSVGLAEMAKANEAQRIKDATEESQKNIKTYYNQLSTIVSSLDTNINGILVQHEKDFMVAFKSHLNEVYTQLNELKEKYSSE